MAKLTTRADSQNHLGEMFRFYLACRNQTLREVASEIGTSAATLMRITQGMEPGFTTMLKVFQWMMKEI